MDWQLVTGISSIVIACSALGISIWQATLYRTHNKISCRPHLTTWEHGGTTEIDFAVDIMNNGIGPAVFTSFKIMVDGHAQNGEGVEPMEKVLNILFPNYNYQLYTAYFGPSYSMASKENQRLIAIKFHGDSLPSKNEIDHAMKRAKVEILYKSFYEEEFELIVTKDKSNNPLKGDGDKAAAL